MKNNILLTFLLLFAFATTHAQVGINTKDPKGALHIDPKGNTTTVGGNSSDDVIVTNTGSLGIGTIAPAAKLQVEGSVMLRGSLDSKAYYRAKQGFVLGKIGLGSIDPNSATKSLEIKTDGTIPAMIIESTDRASNRYLASDAEGNGYWTTFLSPVKVEGMNSDGSLRALCDAGIQISAGSDIATSADYEQLTREPLRLTKGKWIILAKYTVRNYTFEARNPNLGADMLVWTRLESSTSPSSPLGTRKVETEYGFRPELNGWNIATPQFTHLVDLSEDTYFFVSSFLATRAVYRTINDAPFGGSYFCAIRLDEN